jgi:hypothetical protein
MFFLAALFSKSSAVSLPVLLIAIDIYKGQSFNKKLLGEKIPLFILSLIFGIINIFSQSVGGAFNKSILHYSFINRIFLITSSISGYIIRSIIPINLSAMHLFPKVHEGFLPWEHYTSLIFLLFIILIALRRSLFQKEIIFGLCFFCITISPMLPFIPFGHALTAERYSYISYIGLFYIIGQLVSNVKIKKWKIVTITGLSIIMFIFFMQTWDRIGIWQSDTTLDDDMIKKNPDVYFGYWMRGNYEKQEGDLNDALEDYNKVILLDPGNDDAFFNRGKIYASLGNFQSAITNYSKSIQINPKDDAYNNRGWVYYRSGDMKSAILDYDKAISLNPKFIKPYFNRALIEAESGNYTEAISDYSKILKIDPENPDVYYDQGFVFLKMHDTLNACKDWEIIATRGNKQALQMMQLYCR